MNYRPIDIGDKFTVIKEYWSPKIIGALNNYHIKLARVKGDFTWHTHDETDELFIVHRGVLRIDFRDGSVELKSGQLFIVERGKEHKPFAEDECEILLIEPESTVNTGDKKNTFTKETPGWI